MKTIGQNIKFLMKERNIKQIRLATDMGLSPSRLSNYISDKRMPDLETLIKIAIYLNVDLNYFSNYVFNTELISAVKNNSDIISVPYIRINTKEQPKPHGHILLDKVLLKGINEPLIIEIDPESCTNMNKFDLLNIAHNKSALLMTDVLDNSSKNEIVVRIGRRYSVYRYMNVDGAKLLFNPYQQKIIPVNHAQIYYAIKWILQ